MTEERKQAAIARKQEIINNLEKLGTSRGFNYTPEVIGRMRSGICMSCSKNEQYPTKVNCKECYEKTTGRPVDSNNFEF